VATGRSVDGMSTPVNLLPSDDNFEWFIVDKRIIGEYSI